MPYMKYIDFGSVQAIYRIADTAWIPLDTSNTDYQQFLLYLIDNNLTLDDIPLWVP